MNNHQESTFHPLGNFFKPSLGLVKTKFKEIVKWAKIEFLSSFIFIQRPHLIFVFYIRQS
ncbi:hypothetical protein [Bathymodiolus thermophilus thioautotrophic gill symbiont]|nr:hypothetical protein [Bathymodiolus thermophilus thioautotrophic gill symbiont]CAB5502639.1 hypothetical protein THERMOS_1642 [Bathymodiolus thermophilus thioautotrophic gill symbiont]